MRRSWCSWRTGTGPGTRRSATKRGFTPSWGSNVTCFLCQTEEFLPKRVGQSPPDIPGGGRQVLHDDGGPGENIRTRGYM